MFPFEWDTSIEAYLTHGMIRDCLLTTIYRQNTWIFLKQRRSIYFDSNCMHAEECEKKRKRIHADWLKDGVHLLYKNRLEGWNRTIFIDHRNFVSHTGNVCSVFHLFDEIHANGKCQTNEHCDEFISIILTKRHEKPYIFFLKMWSCFGCAHFCEILCENKTSSAVLR